MILKNAERLSFATNAARVCAEIMLKQGKAITADLELRANLIVVEARMNGVLKKFVLDTGASNTTITQAVFDELCQVVEEVIALYHRDGKPLPPPTWGRDFTSKMQNVA